MNSRLPATAIRITTAIFAICLAVTIIWCGLNFLDIWYPGFEVISGHFNITAIRRISAALSASVALSSSLLWHHHRQEASYTTATELFFGACFGLFVFIVMLLAIPAPLSL